MKKLNSLTVKVKRSFPFISSMRVYPKSMPRAIKVRMIKGKKKRRARKIHMALVSKLSSRNPNQRLSRFQRKTAAQLN
jgi:hypothetical protein